jgi:putative oxidoreductase
MLFAPENFDLTNEFNILRILCGVFLIPHSVGKITAWDYSSGFFEKAGFRPVKAWLYATLVFEAVLAAALILGIHTRYAAILCAVFMIVAAVAVLRVTRGKWLWNLGGCEYPVFWAICAIAVAMHG